MELEIGKINEVLNNVENNKSNLIANDKVVSIDKELDVKEASNVKEYTSIISNVIDKGINYTIKALPVADGVKDVALDVKEALKTKDFKEIVKTAVSSSIREGLEFLGAPTSVLRDIKNLKDVSMSGGLSKALSAGVDIVFNKYFKNNLFANIGKDVVNAIKKFLSSKDFISKIDKAFEKFKNDISKFKDTCKAWYSAYEKFNLEDINKNSVELSKRVKNVSNDAECVSENRLIQNITTLINNTKTKLTPIQLEACRAI